MKHDWDAIVVGAGVAGSLAATTLAMKGQDLKVLLLDRNPSSEVGKKNSSGWICGDALGAHHLEYVHSKLGVLYGRPEIENVISEIVVFSPDEQFKLHFRGPGVVLDRPAFGRRMLEDAERVGVVYLGGVQVVDLLTEGAHVSGVACKGTTSELGALKLSSRIVIDASGISSRLRRNLRVPTLIQSEIDRDDVFTAARVNAFLREGVEVDPTRLHIYVDQKKAPGGYLWIFPKSKRKVNVGLGIQQGRSHRSLKSLLDEWVSSTPILREMRLLSDDRNLAGAWPVSLRHQNDCLVANGYMIAGDAAWFPNPISGGGIGPALIGGIMAGEVAARALHDGEVGEENLWEYNVRYVASYGKKTAAMEALRVYLQSLDNAEINYGMRQFTGLMLEAAGIAPQDGFRGDSQRLCEASEFRGLVYTTRRMAELTELYANYPDRPSSFPEWKLKVDNILGDVHRMFRYR